MSEKVTGFLAKLLKKVGEAVAAGMNAEINELRKAIEDQGKRIDENEKDRIRYEILDFANSCHNGRNHTRDEFKHIIKLNTKYIELLKRTNDSNGEFEIEYQYINELYKQKEQDHTFLADGLQYDTEVQKHD